MIPGRHRSDTRINHRLRSLGAGYTWFVKIARLTLPLTALVLIGIVGARLSTDPLQTHITDLPQKDTTTAGQIQLEKARYEGVDGKGRAYTLSADAASRVPEAPDTVLLTKPHADITLADGQWLAAQANSGIYDNAKLRLLLKDGVTVFHDSGYEIHLKDIDIDLKKNRALSKNPVRVQGPIGFLSAQNIDISDEGNIIVFGGPVTLTLDFARLNARQPG